MRGKYYRKLSVEIMSENYDLSYYHAKNVRFIGILAYPKRHKCTTKKCAGRRQAKGEPNKKSNLFLNRLKDKFASHR